MRHAETTIRAFEAADYEAVLALWTDAGFRTGPSESLAGIARKRARDPDLFLVADAQEKIVGAVLGAFDGRRGRIYHLAVAEFHRRAGIGRALLEEVERRLRARGCVKVNLLVEPENTDAVRFYTRLGYQADDLVFMEKWLLHDSGGSAPAALAFEQSSDEAVARLLAVLAGAVRPGGRILEIGTGVGHGTASLVIGLDGRDDVEVVTIEIDVDRHRIAAAAGWPTFVRLLHGDVLEHFDQLGTFSLVFADAQGGKWEGLDRTIEALEPGGLLVVDDMRRPTVEIVPDQAARTEQVRTALFSDPRLQAIELDLGSGVILARFGFQRGARHRLSNPACRSRD